jgi:hypothetical protein
MLGMYVKFDSIHSLSGVVADNTTCLDSSPQHLDPRNARCQSNNHNPTYHEVSCTQWHPIS